MINFSGLSQNNFYDKNYKLLNYIFGWIFLELKV